MAEEVSLYTVNRSPVVVKQTTCVTGTRIQTPVEKRELAGNQIFDKGFLPDFVVVLIASTELSDD